MQQKLCSLEACYPHLPLALLADQGIDLFEAGVRPGDAYFLAFTILLMGGPFPMQSLQDQMIVVFHEALSFAAPFGHVDHRHQNFEKGLPLPVIPGDSLPVVAPGDDVKQHPRVFESRFPRHGPFLARPRSIVNNQA